MARVYVITVNIERIVHTLSGYVEIGRKNGTLNGAKTELIELLEDFRRDLLRVEKNMMTKPANMGML